MRTSIYTLLAIALCQAVVLGQTSVVNTKHNMSASSGNTIRATTGQEVCVFCHTPHTAQSTAPLWNRDQPASSYTLYTSDYLTSLSYPSPSQPNARSKMCMSCHDGTIAIGAVYNVPGGGTSITMTGSTQTMPTSAKGYLSTDLRDDHPVGFGYDNTSNAELVTRSWPWATNVKLDPDASNGRVECHTCHDAHNNQYTYFLRMSNSNAGLCTFCHQVSGWSGASVVHRISTQSYTPAGGTATTIGEWACRSCHGSHNGGSGAYILRATEEATCLQSTCHGSSAPSSTKNIAAQYNKTYVHPTATTTGAHKLEYQSSTSEKRESSSNLGTNRHAECWDCHNSHEAENGTHTVSSSTTISGVLKGTWGVEPTWGTAPTNMTNNDNTWSTVSSYTVTNPATREYQICLKCHSDYISGSQRNIAAEIDPDYPSYHGIVSGGTSNSYCNTTTMVSPWGGSSSRVVWCSDCHGSDDAGTPPKGPHGSNQDHLLVATAVSSSTTGTPLCLVCHKTAHYWSGSGTGSRLNKHPNTESDHRKPKGCFSCHMYDFNSHATYGNGNYGGNSLKIFVHGMNKRYYYRERVSNSNVSQSPIKDMADAFIAGYVADIDFSNKECWTEDPGNTEFNNNCGEDHHPRTY